MGWLDADPHPEESVIMKPTENHESLSPDPGVLRTLDAAFQRLTEGLRSVEDPSRFHLQNSVLASHWQDLRRKTGALRRSLELQVGQLATYRDLGGDPLLELPGAGRHASLSDLIQANLSRCRESARSIEELLRMIDADLSRTMQEIRYGIYAQRNSGHDPNIALERVTITGNQGNAIEITAGTINVDAESTLDGNCNPSGGAIKVDGVDFPVEGPCP